MASSGPYICGSSGEATFCAPQFPFGDYYVAITPPSPETDDVQKISSLFGGQPYNPQSVFNPPSELPFANNSRIYRVNDLLPKIVTSKNGTSEQVLGPNCYYATYRSVLAASGYKNFKDPRYVSQDEFSYYLMRDFFAYYQLSKYDYGTIVVYNDSQLLKYDAGDHAAFILPGGLVFQKGSWQTNYPYEIATIEGAMQAVESHCVLPPKYIFDGGPNPCQHHDYNYRMYYKKRLDPAERSTSSTEKDRNWFLPLMKYYNGRLEDAAKTFRSDSKQNRISLLTVENMQKIYDDFYDRIGNYNILTKLIEMDDDIAEEFLKLKSLRTQYDKMKDTYDVRDRAWKLKDLYKERYVLFDDNFKNELQLYLRLHNVSETRWGEISEAFKEKVKSAYEKMMNTCDPATDVSTLQFCYDANKVPYNKLLEEVIKTAGAS